MPSVTLLTVEGANGVSKARDADLRQLPDLIRSGADEPAEQVAYLLSILGPVGYDESTLETDELAFDLDQALSVARGLVSGGYSIPAVVLTNLSRVDALLDEWSGGDKGDFWKPSGLTHPVWQEVRVLCREALAALEACSG